MPSPGRGSMGDSEGTLSDGWSPPLCQSITEPPGQCRGVPRSPSPSGRLGELVGLSWFTHRVVTMVGWSSGDLRTLSPGMQG